MEPLDPAAALLRGADRLSLRRSQETAVSTLEEDLRASGLEVGGAFRAMRTELAAEVRAGAIDPARVQADESAVTDALQAQLTHEIRILNRLHATLGSSQRAAAVATVRAEQPGRTEAMPEAPSGRSARLDRLTRELRLDSNQQQRVAALLSKEQLGPRAHPKRTNRFDRLISAFARDEFEAGATLRAIAPSEPAMIQTRVQNETALLSRLLPILRVDQRQELASKIEIYGWGSESHAQDSEAQD
jgi:hypothetical protein